MLTEPHHARPGRTSSTRLGLLGALVGFVLIAGLLVGCTASGSEHASEGPSNQIGSTDLPAKCRGTTSTVESGIVPSSTPAPSSTVAFAPSSLGAGSNETVPAAPARAHLRGRIVDGVCRTPIAGAGVFFFSGPARLGSAGSALTDTAGRFDVELARDRYRIAFQNAGLNYDFTWYPDAADFDGATEVALRADTDLPDLELYHPDDQPVPPYEGEGTRRIAVIGDSLVQQSTTAIKRKIDLIGPASVRGIANQRIDQMQPTVERYAATNPDTAVIALGSNDANQDHPIDESVAALERMLDTLDGARCIVVLDLNTHTPNNGFNQAGDDLNERIRRVVAEHPKVRLAPWDATVGVMLNIAPTTEWFTDGLHLTDRGIDVYARAMADATANC